MSAQKLVWGNPLVVLGVEVTVDSEGADLWPAPEKVTKWLAKIDVVLAVGQLTSGEASKLSGHLQWAAQNAFRRLGRAMLRPIIRQIRSRNSAIGQELRLALMWWRSVLSMQIRRVRCVCPETTGLRRIVCGPGSDAAGIKTQADKCISSATLAARLHAWLQSSSCEQIGS